ncbi:hypothetical protein EDB87DRAFT_1352067 [Lactarius vividus]|nr:hypothetical protein EDB87DRAFT_1352067 [Lactarius vividus]
MFKPRDHQNRWPTLCTTFVRLVALASSKALVTAGDCPLRILSLRSPECAIERYLVHYSSSARLVGYFIVPRKASCARQTGEKGRC